LTEAHLVPRESQVPAESQVSAGLAVPAELLEFIKDGNKFIIAGHREPDGDCVGSQLALTSVLRRMGKEAIPFSTGPFKRTEIKPYEHLFTSALDEKTKAGARVIIVDCSTADRIGDMEPFWEEHPMAIIDHHDNADCPKWLGGEGLAYVDLKALSTTFMVLNVIKALGLEPLKEEAELLFFGLCTDTGFFRHIDGKGAQVFDAAAALIRAGANPKAAFAAMHGGKSLNSRKLLGHILLRAESQFAGV